MAQDFLSGPLAQPFLAPLSLLPDGEPVRILVLAVVLNRACLLAELPEASLARFSGQRSILHDCLNSAVLRARASVGLSSDPRRFLPESAFSLLGRTDVPWKEITRLSRPFFWSWPEVIAARGPVCAFGLGLALEMLYSPGQFSKLPGGTFEERCIHSGCSHLILRIDLASGGKDPPVCAGPPRASIALSGLALSSSSSSLLASRRRIPSVGVCRRLDQRIPIDSTVKVMRVIAKVIPVARADVTQSLNESLSRTNQKIMCSLSSYINTHLQYTRR